MRVTQNKVTAWERKNGGRVCCIIKTLQQIENASIYFYLLFLSFPTLYLCLNLAFCGLLGPQGDFLFCQKSVFFLWSEDNFNETCLEPSDKHILICDEGDEEGEKTWRPVSLLQSFPQLMEDLYKEGRDRTSVVMAGPSELLSCLSQTFRCDFETPWPCLASSSVTRGGWIWGSLRPLSVLTFAESWVTNETRHKYASRNVPSKRNASSTRVKPFRQPQAGILYYLAAFRSSYKWSPLKLHQASRQNAAFQD